MHVAQDSVIGGKYRLELPLSRGGMGSVWTARHVSLGSPVAVKFMDVSLAASPAFIARFEREARIAANLQSPHVVHVQDYGFDRGVPYLVMELLQGEDLGTRLRRVGRMPLQQAMRVLTQVGRAVRRAHEVGLVHRDLKPGNIFLARVEDEEIAKVLDFGIVKETGVPVTGEVTKTGEVLGSPHYMSPEQVRGDRDVDHRSDLWALGIILFRMLTGHLPFPGDQLGAVIAKILVDPLPRATALAPDLPPAIDGFFAQALARDRGQRFQSVGAMLEELGRIASAALGASTLGMPTITTWPPAATSSPPSPPSLSPGTLAGTGASDTAKTLVRKQSAAPAFIAIAGTVLVLGIGAGFLGWRARGASSAESAESAAGAEGDEPTAAAVTAAAAPQAAAPSPGESSEAARAPVATAEASAGEPAPPAPASGEAEASPEPAAAADESPATAAGQAAKKAALQAQGASPAAAAAQPAEKAALPAQAAAVVSAISRPAAPPARAPAATQSTAPRPTAAPRPAPAATATASGRSWF